MIKTSAEIGTNLSCTVKTQVMKTHIRVVILTMQFPPFPGQIA